ncbi:MFS general substrate transporter [Tothia fuscella]|uniref:MFS general substrate transporter n=1 Tax=Tothia fuscella TaxID=1048955 RepID=A0A9P4P3P0_9PEZI|nr:MFS general substrate transporter [Tothia fuscella]
MTDLFRDTFAGQAIRLITRGHYLKYPEEQDTMFTQQILERSLSGIANLVSWTDPHDQANCCENPQNWSFFKKCFVTGLVCFLTFSIYIGSAIYTAGSQGVAEQFQVSATVATLGLTLFVLGYGIGPMFLFPFAEAPPIGRMPLYVITLAISLFFNFGSYMRMKNIGMLRAFRFLTGFFGMTSICLDVWETFAVFGPVMGPLIGGFAVENEDWTWTIWELIWLSGFCLVLLIFTLPETSAVTILYKRAYRLRLITGNVMLKSAAEIEAEDTSVRAIIIASLWPFPIVFSGIYHFDLGRNGLTFLGILIGAFFIMKPLPPAIVGSVCIVICMFWFGWTSRESIHWIVPVIGSSFFSMGAVLLFNSVLNYQGDSYPVYVGSVLAGNDLMRCAFGGAFPLFAPAMFHKLGVDWASIREKSRFAGHDI